MRLTIEDLQDIQDSIGYGVTVSVGLGFGERLTLYADTVINGQKYGGCYVISEIELTKIPHNVVLGRVAEVIKIRLEHIIDEEQGTEVIDDCSITLQSLPERN